VADTDDVARLKEELAQFLLSEIATAQGGQAFRREVEGQVGAVVDAMLAERLKPALDNLERQAAEQAQRTNATLDDALARLKAGTGTDTAATEQKLSEIAASLEQLRQRVGKVEENAKPQRVAAATAQPLQPRTEAKLADERIAAPPLMSAPALPGWLFWLLVALLVLSVLGLGNLYYEKLSKPDVATPPPVAFTPPAPVQTSAPVTSAPAMTAPASSPAPQQTAVSVPPQNPAAIAPVTPKPVPTPVTATPLPGTPAPQPASHIPADFAIERGWMAAQPYAVEPRLARHAGVNEASPTLKSLVCGRSPNCTSDSLMTDGTEAKQLIALQMLMSQIGDRFCVPRQTVAVTGKVSQAGLVDLAGIARCAGGAPSACKETQTRVCPPDSDALISGSDAARATLLRWALWKTGST
jgi:hypothetical protein